MRTRLSHQGTPQGSPSSSGRDSRLEILAFGLVFLAAIWFRVQNIHEPLWMDEAWVANSVLEPSMKEMFWYQHWVQSTPPLVLLLLRMASKLFGPGEESLRLVPLLAGLLALLLIARVLRRRFSFPLALLGTTFLAANYYAAKYSQQVKQYSTDILMSSLLLFFLWNYLESERCRKGFLTLLAGGSLAVFLSYPAVFWFPALIVGVALPPPGPDAQPEAGRKLELRAALGRAVTLSFFLLASFALAYWFFIRPSQSPTLLGQWRGSHLGSGSLPAKSTELFRNVCSMLLPQARWLVPISYAAGLVLVAGLARAVWSGNRKDPRSRGIVLVCATPVLAATLASLANQYPLLTYPRFVLWMLPGCIVLLLYAVEALGKRLSLRLPGIQSAKLRYGMLPGFCVLAVLSSAWYVRAHPGSGDDARSAVLYLKSHAVSTDALFLHGGLAEEFDYYRRGYGLSASKIYLGNTEWPCCSQNKKLRVSNPEAHTLREDLQTFLRLFGPGRVWLILPTADDPGHWSFVTRKSIPQAWSLMESEGCRQIERQVYQNAQVILYSCGPLPNLSN